MTFSGGKFTGNNLYPSDTDYWAWCLDGCHEKKYRDNWHTVPAQRGTRSVTKPDLWTTDTRHWSFQPRMQWLSVQGTLVWRSRVRAWGQGNLRGAKKDSHQVYSMEPREGPGKDGMGDSGWGQECSAWDSVWMLPHGSVECSRVAQQRRKFCSVDSHPGAFYSGPKGSAGIYMREVYVWESLVLILDTSPQSSNSLRCWVSEPPGAMWPKWS